MEREKTEERKTKVIAWTEPVLLSPQHANSIGILTEAPVLILPPSGSFFSPWDCKKCGKQPPSICSVGSIYHHSHEEKIGGICYVVSSPTTNYFPTSLGWAVILEPLGEKGKYISDLGCHHIDTIRLDQFVAFCRSEIGERSDDSYCDCWYHQLKEGFVADLHNSGILYPVCNLKNHPDHRLSDSLTFCFQISDIGEVHFSKI